MRYDLEDLIYTRFHLPRRNSNQYFFFKVKCVLLLTIKCCDRIVCVLVTENIIVVMITTSTVKICMYIHFPYIHLLHLHVVTDSCSKLGHLSCCLLLCAQKQN